MTAQVIHGECLEVLRDMADSSVDSIVTDPPYGLSFMGKRWDYDVPSSDIWAECLRVLKPGGYLLAFAGTRTQHRMAVRIEDAGFEIRDMIAWVYGSGFPKSHNGEWGGTALKPALEPITMARKPMAGTVEQNWREHGTGALNIDECRVAGEPWKPHSATGLASAKFFTEGDAPVIDKAPHDAGRWPANLIHDGSEEVLAAFPGGMGGNAHSGFADLTGNCSRFFYCAKASAADREDGLDGFDIKPAGALQERADGSLGSVTRRRNTHPTVKPTELMRYLCRLVTPPGGLIVDPFAGSGSTGKAAVLEGFDFIGIEREAQYVEIARARISAVSAQKSLFA